MKIKIAQSTLLKRLELVGRISTKHITLPVLQCVVISVTESEVKLKATNLEIAMEVTLPEAQIEGAGVIAVPTSVLLQVVQHFVNETIELSVNEDGLLEVQTKKTTTTIKPIDHEEFPSIPRITSDPFTINKKLFSLGIRTTAFAASQSSIKPELGSVYIYQKKEHTLTFVTTDSFRLMEKTVTQKGVVFDQSLLIPHKNAVEIARVCDLLDDDPEMMMTDTQCALWFGSGVYITTRLTTGSFPDYTAIIPKEFSTHSVVLKQDLLTAFKKTNVFLNKYNQVTCDVTVSELIVSAQNGDVGTVTDTIPAQTTGDEIRLSFNQQYITEPLSYIQDDSLQLHFAGIGRPLVVEGVTDNSLRYLVMPMNK